MAPRTPDWAPGAGGEVVPQVPAAHRELLRREFLVNVRVRFVVATVLMAGGLAAWLAGGPSAGGAPVVVALGVVVAVYNQLLRAQLRSAGGHTLPYHYAAVLLDVCVLALVVAFLGGIRSPFMAVYFVHLTLSCFLYSKRAATGIVVVILALILAQAGLEVVGIAPAQLLVGPEPLPPLEARAALEIVLVYWLVAGSLAWLLIPTATWARRGQAVLEQQRDELAARSRLRRDFLQLAVHNLRSPLAASLMHMENLRSGVGGELTDTQRRWLGRMGARLDSLMEMLEDLRMLASTEVVRMDELAERVDVAELLTRLAGEYRARAGDRALDLVLEIDPATPPARGVPVLIREALANYVANAVLYGSAPGTVALRALPAVLDDRPVVRVEVADEGPGISEEHQPQLFQEFARIPRPRSLPVELIGSGLGLSLVHRIAERHGGRVGVDTGAGRPSTFWVEFPVWVESESVRPDSSSHSRESSPASPPPPASAVPR